MTKPTGREIADEGLHGWSVPLESANVSRLELALDTPAHEAVLPFWAAVLPMEHVTGPDVGDELRDSSDGLPAIWFQPSGSEEPRRRRHPSFRVLGDPEGNRVCLCTWQQRD
jgi:4a-hydroxytetrahydrobiopterin dehydratase